MRKIVVCLFWIFGFCCCLETKAQTAHAGMHLLYSTDEENEIEDSTTQVAISEIQINGNKQSKDYIILRELPFDSNEEYTLKDLASKFSEAKRRLMNTGLFHHVAVSLNSVEGDEAIVSIDVKERWYIIPIPFLRFVDRSFGEWVQEKGMDLNRVNYGMRVTHYNFTGRNDKLYVNLKNGFTKELALSYRGLMLDKDLKWSTSLGFYYGKDKEVNYNSVGNKLMAYKKKDEFVRTYLESFLEFSYRPVINTKHTLGMGYFYENVSDTVTDMNPSYLFHSSKTSYPSFYYTLSYFNNDFIPYPTKGYAAEVTLEKRGLNKKTNLWQLKAKGSGYWPLSEKYFVNLRMAGVLKLPFRQPYIHQRFVGYQDLFMQGYEYYVIDGVAGGYAKLSLSRELFNTTIRIPSERIKRLNNIPFRAYAKIFGNTGYIHNPHSVDNPLNNQVIYSGGFGIDLVTFYDFIVKLEFSFNQLGQNGLYLHRKENF